MLSPRISVIMPVYNAARYLKESIESILNQTFSDFEFIIIDDCSTDNSYAIIKDFALLDDRVRVFRNKENYKQAYTRNFGIKQSSGQYIVFMDADDVALPDRVSKQFEYMESNPSIDIAGVWYTAYDQEMRQILYKQMDPLSHWEIVINMHLFRNALAQYVIVKRNVFDKIMYDSSFKNLAEDYELWLRAISCGFKLANISDFLMKYRVYNESSCHENAEKIDTYIQSVHRVYLKELLQDKYSESIAKSHEQLIYRNKTLLFFLRNIIDYNNHLTLLKQANIENEIYPPQEFNKVLTELSLIHKIKNKIFKKK